MESNNFDSEKGVEGSVALKNYDLPIGQIKVIVIGCWK